MWWIYATPVTSWRHSSATPEVPTRQTEASDRGRSLRCLTPDNMTKRPARAFYQALNEDTPWSISLHYRKRLILSKAPRTTLRLGRRVPSNISTSTPQPCLKEMIMKIAHLLLSSAALLAVSSAAFADARNKVISVTIRSRRLGNRLRKGLRSNASDC